MGHYRGFKTCILEGTMKFQQLTVRSGDSPWCGGTISSPVWESLQLPGSFLQTQHTTVPDKWESSVYDAMLRLPSSSVSPSDRACAQENWRSQQTFQHFVRLSPMWQNPQSGLWDPAGVLIHDLPVPADICTDSVSLSNQREQNVNKQENCRNITSRLHIRFL